MGIIATVAIYFIIYIFSLAVLTKGTLHSYVYNKKLKNKI